MRERRRSRFPWDVDGVGRARHPAGVEAERQGVAGDGSSDEALVVREEVVVGEEVVGEVRELALADVRPWGPETESAAQRRWVGDAVTGRVWVERAMRAPARRGKLLVLPVSGAL